MRRWCANAREVGRGERITVVLAHGYGVNQASWDKILPSLVASNTNKVLLFDWDFTGDGDGGAHEDEADVVGEDEEAARYTFGKFADDLISLMDEREVSGAVFVGHSMSAMIGCIASARRPDLFAHLLLCASPGYINSEDYVGGFEEAAIHAMLGAMESDLPGWVKAFVPNAAGDASSVGPLEQSFLAMDPDVALGLARMIFLADQRGALNAVSAPCTIVQAREDFAAPPTVAEYMRRRMPRTAAVAVEIVDSVGHFPQFVAPRRVLDILEGVLLLLREEGALRDDAEEGEVVAAADVKVDGGIDVTT